MNRKAQVIAFYLPQFHPIPENDEWWGKGFTEWTNVGKAKPLFRGHYQPRVPADLGYYDLRIPEVREAQAQMAHKAGIEGFCYWHYWFGNGKRLLEKPFQEVLESGKPDFPFCLGWANETWTNKSWEEGTRQIKKSILMEQIYDENDYVKHFYAVLPAFKDKRYITIDDKPLFVVFKPLDIPNSKIFIDTWNRLAEENGLKGVYFVGIRQNMDESERRFFFKNKKIIANNIAQKYNEILKMGFDAVNSRGYWRAEYYASSTMYMLYRWIMRKLFRRFLVIKCKQSDINKFLYSGEDTWENVYPTLIPSWDRSPRSGVNARIYTDSTPELFKQQIEKALSLLENRKDENKILFLQSWNEWAEGNYVEPDLKFGKGYINVLREMLVE
ncbi:MAG: glycoside hydrolase family 99-like domain-containing protein [Prevotellaceae bacterium]|jgi:hypothetical protein|nr:glycoside hydrolase family 99-like domain-containing protein [Prevotellaceae bacterium]